MQEIFNSFCDGRKYIPLIKTPRNSYKKSFAYHEEDGIDKKDDVVEKTPNERLPVFTEYGILSPHEHPYAKEFRMKYLSTQKNTMKKFTEQDFKFLEDMLEQAQEIDFLFFVFDTFWDDTREDRLQWIRRTCPTLVKRINEANEYKNKIGKTEKRIKTSGPKNLKDLQFMFLVQHKLLPPDVDVLHTEINKLLVNYMNSRTIIARQDVVNTFLFGCLVPSDLLFVIPENTFHHIGRKFDQFEEIGADTEDDHIDIEGWKDLAINDYRLLPITPCFYYDILRKLLYTDNVIDKHRELYLGVSFFSNWSGLQRVGVDTLNDPEESDRRKLIAYKNPSIVTEFARAVFNNDLTDERRANRPALTRPTPLTTDNVERYMEDRYPVIYNLIEEDSEETSGIDIFEGDSEEEF